MSLLTFTALSAMFFVAYTYTVTNIAELSILCILFGIAIGSLVIISLRDPGYLPIVKRRVSPMWTYCDYCDSFRPPGAVHCRVCNICIGGFDHHCPWTGKCIGRNNVKVFRIFIVSSAWYFIYFTILVIIVAIDYSMIQE
jgi:hypothetical protein